MEALNYLLANWSELILSGVLFAAIIMATLFVIALLSLAITGIPVLIFGLLNKIKNNFKKAEIPWEYMRNGKPYGKVKES